MARDADNLTFLKPDSCRESVNGPQRCTFIQKGSGVVDVDRMVDHMLRQYPIVAFETGMDTHGTLQVRVWILHLSGR